MFPAVVDALTASPQQVQLLCEMKSIESDDYWERPSRRRERKKHTADLERKEEEEEEADQDDDGYQEEYDAPGRGKPIYKKTISALKLISPPSPNTASSFASLQSLRFTIDDYSYERSDKVLCSLFTSPFSFPCLTSFTMWRHGGLPGLPLSTKFVDSLHYLLNFREHVLYSCIFDLAAFVRLCTMQPLEVLRARFCHLMPDRPDRRDYSEEPPPLSDITLSNSIRELMLPDGDGDAERDRYMDVLRAH
jgi:hypothetical protein